MVNIFYAFTVTVKKSVKNFIESQYERTEMLHKSDKSKYNYYQKPFML